MRLGIRARATIAFGLIYIAFAAIATVANYALLQQSLEDKGPTLRRAERIEAEIIELAGERGVSEADLAGLLDRLEMKISAAKADVRDASAKDSGKKDPTDLEVIWEEAAVRAEAAERDETLDSLLRISVVVGLLTALAETTAGWFVVHRLLRPIRNITSVARRASADSLDQRIAWDGPQDELREMADTFDEMLDRLHQSLDAQRRFAANAAHEMRTPLAVIRAEPDAARTSPDAGSRELSLADRVDAASTRSERLVDALLTLAHADSGTQDHVDLDLGTLVGDLVVEHAGEFSEARLEIDLHLIDDGDPEALHIEGDPILMDRLVINLLDNAIKHATPDTAVEIEVAASEGPDPGVRLRMTNDTSPLGFGLGLAIVRAVAASHYADLDTSQPTADSFEVTVTFPRRT